MDTINITPAQNSLRSIALVTGVVIAIICSLISLKKIDGSESSEASVERSMETPAVVKLHVINKTVSLVGHTVMIISE